MIAGVSRTGKIYIIYRYLTTYILWTYTQKCVGEINTYIHFT